MNTEIPLSGLPLKGLRPPRRAKGKGQRSLQAPYILTCIHIKILLFPPDTKTPANTLHARKQEQTAKMYHSVVCIHQNQHPLWTVTFPSGPTVATAQPQPWLRLRSWRQESAPRREAHRPASQHRCSGTLPPRPARDAPFLGR